MKLQKQVNPKLFGELYAKRGKCQFTKTTNLGDSEVEVFQTCAVDTYLPCMRQTIYTGKEMEDFVKNVRRYDLNAALEYEERANNAPGQDDLENMNANEADDYNHEF
jgi:hypothetical protein